MRASAFTGGHWPPKGIEVLDPWHLPLINTLILLTSGTTVTWAHHALLHNDREGLKKGLVADHPARHAVHLRSRPTNISHAPFALQGFDLWRDLLHGDRLPRLPCDRRHDLPDRLPDARLAPASSRRSSISASNSPPGTGISSTWSGCSCSPASMSGARGAPPMATNDARTQSAYRRPEAASRPVSCSPSPQMLLDWAP